MLSGMVRMMRYPREAAIAARPMPVLPLVGSMMTEPDWSWPDASASLIMASAIRSFMLPAGFR